MKQYKIYGNFGQLLNIIDAEDENDAFDQIEGIYTTEVELVEV